MKPACSYDPGRVVGIISQLWIMKKFMKEELY